MKRLAAAMVAVALVLAPGCSRKPSSWKDWMDEAPAAWKAERFDEAFEHCRKAFDYAVAERSGPRAVGALEVHGRSRGAAGEDGEGAPGFRGGAARLRRRPARLGRRAAPAQQLRRGAGRGGRKQEGVDLLDASLDAYEGTPQRSLDNFRVRMQLVSNLARAVRRVPRQRRRRADLDGHPEGDREPPRERALPQQPAVHARHRRRDGGDRGAHPAAGDPRSAEELLGQAREQLAIEDGVLGGQMRRIPCEPVSVRSLVLRPCFATLR
jgi:hypothetical protein